MQNKTLRFAKPGLLAVLIAAFALAICAAAPAKAMAAQVMAYSLDGDYRQEYYSTDEALTAGYSGKTIYLDCDWYFTGTMQIADSKTITIDMNGHRITTNGKATVILLNEKANLTLKSSTTETMFYSGFDENGNDASNQSIQTGGLVCEGGSSNEVGGIRMNNGSTLTLDNVAVAGNQGVTCGGIYMKKNCTLNINNGASVTNNKGNSGGIWVNEEHSTINMSAGLVNKNYSTKYAAGITSNDDYTTIKMNNSSSICENYGRGVSFRYTYFTLTSEDNKTSTIKDNVAIGDGAGIEVEEKGAAKNEGTIENITISGNKNSSKDSRGAGIALNQRYTRVTNCDIINNYAGDVAGGIYVSGNNCSITSCTITGNKCGGYKSSVHGGGVFVRSSYDVYLSGKCLISGNYDSESNEESDVVLQHFEGAWGLFDSQAYIKGGVDDGSSVGIYYPSTAGTKIGVDVTNYTYGTYFSNKQGVCITKHEDNTLWISSGSEGYLAKVNGVDDKRYQKDAEVTANGKSSDSTKHFWYWDTTKTTGLSPIETYIGDGNRYDEVLTYRMPNNDTDLQAVYVDYVKSAILAYSKPEVGKELPTTGEFVRTDGAGVKTTVTADLTWYSIDENNNMSVVSGVAEAGKKYRAIAKVAENKEIGQFFNLSVLPCENVTIRTSSTGEGDEEAYFVGINDGSLAVWSEAYEMPKPTIESVEDITINVRSGYTKAQVEEVLPTFATVKLSDGTEYMINTEIKTAGVGVFAWPDGLLVDDKVVTVEEGKSQEFNTTVKLVDSEGKVASVDGKVLNVKIVVKPESTPLEPSFSPYPTEYTGTSLKVTAETRSEDATIWYTVNGEDETEYNSSTGIVLTTAEGTATTFKVKAWAVRNGEGGGVKSAESTATYTLNDKANKKITVNCSDTGLVAQGQSAWTSSFDVTGTIDETVAVEAPSQNGRVFDHWEWAGAPEGTDLKSATLTIANYSTDLSGQITAVYTPVISTINLVADAPVAHTALAEKATSVNIGVGTEAASTDISSYLDSTALTWSPEDRGADGNAAHNTTYAATLSLKAGSTSADGVKYLLADDVKLLVNGQDVSGGAYIVGNPDGTKSMKVDFPSTGPYEYDSFLQPSDVTMTYGEALAYQADQEQSGKSSWKLQNLISVAFKCKEKKTVDVTWDKVTAFDPDATGAQSFKVKGTVKYTDEIDSTDAPQTVEVTINVDAPETVATPAASVDAGTYALPQTVKLSCDTEDAVIYYTTDGTEPTEDSEKYSGDAIEVLANNMTIKACAFKNGMKASKVATFDYTIDYQQVSAPVATPAAGTYDSVQQVALGTDASEAELGDLVIYYTIDGSDPTSDSLIYEGPITVNESMTIKAIVVDKSGRYVPSEITTLEYVINSPAPAPTPSSSGDGDSGSNSGSNGASGNASAQAGLAATGDAAPFALVGFAALVACAAFALAALKLRRNR